MCARNAASRRRAQQEADAAAEGDGALPVDVVGVVGFRYPSDEGHDDSTSDLHGRTAAEALRELVERIFAVPTGRRHEVHCMAYQRVCALGLMLLSDGDIVETLQPAIVAKRLGFPKQTVGANMERFVERLGMHEHYQRRRHADYGHNKSRTMKACDRTVFLKRDNEPSPSVSAAVRKTVVEGKVTSVARKYGSTVKARQCRAVKARQCRAVTPRG